MRFRAILVLIAALAIPATAFAGGKGDANAGKTVFHAHCTMCHGQNGEGNQALAKMMKTTIPPLSSKAVQSLSDAEIRTVIEKGKGKMTPVRGLTSAQIDDVIAFVRTLAKK
jgi:mono/diheme cytochrome c family protein